MATKKKSAPAKGAKLGTFAVGDAVLIRAIPFYYIGTIEQVLPDFVLLAAGAVWLSDTGRFSTCLTTGQVSECEAYPGAVLVARVVIADVTAWTHAIPGTK